MHNVFKVTQLTQPARSEQTLPSGMRRKVRDTHERHSINRYFLKSQLILGVATDHISKSSKRFYKAVKCIMLVVIVRIRIRDRPVPVWRWFPALRTISSAPCMAVIGVIERTEQLPSSLLKAREDGLYFTTCERAGSIYYGQPRFFLAPCPKRPTQLSSYQCVPDPFHSLDQPLSDGGVPKTSGACVPVDLLARVVLHQVP
jgi:hypothetical protein